jgi:hypothetical protein
LIIITFLVLLFSVFGSVNALACIVEDDDASLGDEPNNKLCRNNPPVPKGELTGASGPGLAAVTELGTPPNSLCSFGILRDGDPAGKEKQNLLRIMLDGWLNEEAMTLVGFLGDAEELDGDLGVFCF